LSNKTYEQDVYAVFKKQDDICVGKPQWSFVGFGVKGENVNSEPYLTFFSPLPRKAKFAMKDEDFALFVYNCDLELHTNINHILEERENRLPKIITDRVPNNITAEERRGKLKDVIKQAVINAEKQIEWSWSAAVPQYCFTRKIIQLLIPLSLDDPKTVDVALAVERENEVYTGRTILSLDMAYKNARLITRPHSDWLKPDSVYAVDDVDESDNT